MDEEDGSDSVDGLECVGLGVRDGGVVCRGDCPLCTWGRDST